MRSFVFCLLFFILITKSSAQNGIFRPRRLVVLVNEDSFVINSKEFHHSRSVSLSSVKEGIGNKKFKVVYSNDEKRLINYISFFPYCLDFFPFEEDQEYCFMLSFYFNNEKYSLRRPIYPIIRVKGVVIDMRTTYTELVNNEIIKPLIFDLKMDNVVAIYFGYYQLEMRFDSSGKIMWANLFFGALNDGNK